MTTSKNPTKKDGQKDENAPETGAEKASTAEQGDTKQSSTEGVSTASSEEETQEKIETTDVAEESELTDDALENMPVAELAAALTTAREEISDMKDGFLRAKAEMENIRRRSQNEVVNARKYAVEGFAQELLNVKDSLDQAALVELDESESEAVVKMKEGLMLTLKQLETALGKFSVTEVEAAPGVKFNPEHHQAISMLPSEEIESNHIIDVMQKGFLLKDRLLRPAMVAVAS